MQFKKRLWFMLVGWSGVGLVYGSTGFISGEKWIIPELWLDQQIPFNVQGIWLYLSFFLVVPFTFLYAPVSRIKPAMMAVLCSAFISGVFFVLLPTTIVYPQVTGDSVSHWVFYALLWIDTEQNCLPSLHASITVICLLALWSNQKRFLSLIYLIISLAIGFSIIQLRRHLSIDVGAGILVGILSYVVAIKFARANLQQREN